MRLESFFAVVLTLSASALGQATRPAPQLPPEVAALNAECTRLGKQGEYAQAIPFAQRYLDQVKGLGDAYRPEHASALNNLGYFLQKVGDNDAAEPLYRQELEFLAEEPNVDRDVLAASGAALSNLASVYRSRGAYRSARALYGQAIETKAAALGENDPGYATGLDNLAMLLQETGDYRQAEALHKRAAGIYLRALGDHDPEYATCLLSLAQLYRDQGKYDQAEALFQQVTEIYKSTVGDKHPRYALAMNSLGLLYMAKGDYERAEPMLEQSAELARRALGETNPQYAAALSNLAVLYKITGDYARAEAVCRKALLIRTQAGVKPADYAQSFNNLAEVYIAQKDYHAAEPLLEQAAEAFKSALGEQHPEYATALDNLATLYRRERDFARAEPLARQASGIYRKSRGDSHPDLAVSLDGLAELLADNGKPKEALRVFRDARAMQVRLRDLVLGSGSQREQAAYVANVYRDYSIPLSLAAGPLADDPAAASFAAQLVLSDKGAIREALIQRYAAAVAGQEPAARDAYDRWRLARAGLAHASLATLRAGPGEADDKNIDKLEREAESAEKDLARSSVKFAGQMALAAAGPEQVAATLKPGSALVEFARYRQFNFGAAVGKPLWGESSYLALVIRGGNDGGAPKFSVVKLGSARDIEQAARDWLQRVRRPDSTQDAIERAGQALAARVWKPLIHDLDNCRSIYIAPDGDLAFIPFGAVPAATPGSFLLDDYDIAYVATGRDLTRQQVASDRVPLLVGDPEFGAAGAPGPGERHPVPTQSHSNAPPRPRDAAPSYFVPLPGTGAELTAVAKLLQSQNQQPTILRGADATEAAVKAARHPSILHLATHGFFLTDNAAEDELGPARSERGIGAIRPAIEIASSDPDPIAERFWQQLREQDPMRRSGVALAGANDTLAGRHEAGGDDGILTAEEIVGIDLWGTRLVTISACQSGLGEIKGGEGVYGLRRALSLAGARTVVMSLWSVDDQATARLMQAMYAPVARGVSPQQALLKSQRAYIASERKAGRYPSPFYWAAFVASGTGIGL